MAIPGFRRLLGKSEKRHKDQRRESRRHHFQKKLGRRLVHETLESRQLLSATPSLNQDAIDMAIQRSTDLTLYDPSYIQEAQQWVIRVEDGTNIRELASAMGTDALLPTGLIPNTYYFKVPPGSTSALDILETQEQLDFFYPLIAVPATFRFEPNDPLFPDQWHLLNIGQTRGTPGIDANVTGAWESVSGAGIVIGIVDDGVQYTHPDLAAKYRPELSYDFFENAPDPMPLPGDAHGTAVAGVAAAVTNNDLGVAGAGRDADIAALRLLTIPDNVVANMLTHQNQNIHIYNHSYGPPDNGRLSTPVFGPGPLTLAALQESVTTGRGGLGNIHVWAAGNGLLEQDNVNYDGYANSRFTIAVAAVDHDGRQSGYSEPGAPIIVTAPSAPAGAVGITTTDLMAPDGYNPAGDYTNDFGGTSSSAPLVSGVLSLVLEANPDLTYRDVQHILVNTARHNDPTDPDWTTNAAGRLINHKYGFGMIDATAAVEAAQSWTTVPDEISYGSGSVLVGASIPEGSPEGAVSTISVPQDINIEWVEVVFNATHPQSGDLQVELIAPSGTSSILAETRPVIDAGVYSNWVFTSARHWGEDAEGDWTLVVRDQGGLGTGGTFNSWELNVYGTESIPDADRPAAPPAREIPAIGPQLIAARPNEGHLLLPNKVNDPLFVAPREVHLLFQGGGNIAAGTDLNDAIRITRQGSDGAFDYAYAKTDFYTGAGLGERDRVELKIEAVLLGEKQDGITVTFTTSDHGSDDRQPIIHVNGRMITVDLNAQEGFETTGGVLEQALNSHPATSRLIRATVSGNTALPLTDNLPRAASVVSDMNTITSPRLGGWAELEFTAVNPGTAGNDIQLVVTKSDHDNRNMAPFINVDGTTISIDLNSQDGYRTRAQQLVDAINQHPEAGALIQGRVVAGNLLADLAAVEIDYSPLELQDGHDGNGHPTPLAPLVLAGAGKAEVSSSFGIQGLEVGFRATQPGPESNGLQVAVLAADRGANQAPRVRVDGRKITVTLNTNATTPRVTSRDLVNAINAHAGASALVQASIVLGDYELAGGATEPAARSIAAAAPLTLRLDGADEIITPGYVGLGDAGSEVILRFAQTLPDDYYRIEIFAVDDPNRGIQALRNTAGIPLTPSQPGADREIIDFQLNLAPQIISVVPQPVTKPIRVFLGAVAPPGGQFQLILQGERTANISIAASAADVQSALEALANVEPGEVRVTKPTGGSGGVWEIAFFGRYVNLPLADLRSDQPAVRFDYLAKLQQATDQVLVYFNEDELLVEAAENPAHYRLVDTAGTATIEDDRILVPEHVRYYPEQNLAVLTFDGRLPHATYRLEIGQTSGSHGTMETAISVGTLFDTTAYENLSWLEAGGSELYRIWLPETADLDVVVVPDSALSAHGQLDARIDLLTPTGDPVGPASNEVRTLAYAGATPVAGQFELTFAGQTTVPLDFDAMALDVQNALSALPAAALYPIVSVTGGPLPSAPIQVEFDGASIPDLQITSDSTNGRLGISMQDRLLRSNLSAGTYYVKVSSIAGLGMASSGSYFLQMNSSATVSPDDDNSSFTTATDLGVLGAAGQVISDLTVPVGALPTLPNVDQGTLIDNNVPVNIPGFFSVQPGPGGEITLFSDQGVTAQGNTQFFIDASWIYEFLNFVDIGGNGDAINLADTTITLPPTLVSPDFVVSEGVFPGSNGDVNWRVETFLNDGEAVVWNRVRFDSAAPLGDIQLINYLDEDVEGVSDDILWLTGSPGQPDFRAFTLDGPERVGFGQGGIYLPGPNLVNATYDGWAADDYPLLRSAIMGSGSSYSAAGNINLASLPAVNDPHLGAIYGPADITTAFAWSVDPASTSATITSFLELVPLNPVTSASIQPQTTIVMPPYPGGKEEPGHRDIPVEEHINGPPAAVAGTTPYAPTGITQFQYFFGDVYGVDAQGNPLSNQITTEQKIRAREIFDLWAKDLGIEFIEVSDPAQQTAGILQVVTGETRVIAGTNAPGVMGQTNTGQLAAIMAAQVYSGDHQYGGGWFQTAMHEIGHAIGLGHSYDQISIMGEGDPQKLEPSYTGPNPEPVFPFDVDLVHGRRIHRPDSTDIDLYKFQLQQDGWFAVETVAQRQASLLDSVLTLFDVDGKIVASNDDYYSKDSLIEVYLASGTYYVGVTSTGNTAYDPTVRDSGFGGTTDGEYQLQLRFLPDRENGLVDASASRVELDGNNDGRPGGLFQFWFQAGDESIFVDKSVSTSPGNPEGSGTAADPYDSIAWAIADSASRIVTPDRGLDAIEDGDSFAVYLGATRHRFEFDLNGDGVRTNHTAVIVHPVQTLAFDRVPVSGQFRLTFAGQETAPLSFSASNADIRSALIALPNINAADIRVTGGPINTTPVDIEFLNRMAGTYVPPLTVGSNTTSATLRVIEDQRSLAVAISNAVNSLIPPASAVASLTPAGTAVRITGATRVDVSGSPGLLTASNLVRIVGNPGTDNDPNTWDDSHAYLIGTNNQNLPLEDGNDVIVPQGVTMMIDEGALLKLRRANIDVGLTVTNVDRRGGALQVLGTPDRPVLFRSFHDDDFGGDTDPNDKGPEAGDWGGLVVRASSDLDREGIFLNRVNHADLRHGGGKVFVGSVQSDFTPIYLATARPTIAYNTISDSAGAAISADPNSFNDRDGRIGPDIFGNQVVDNSINALLVRIRTQGGAPLDKLSVNARFDNTDIVHVISENLHIVGNPGGPVLTADGLQPRLSGRLAIDPGVVVKLSSARIEAERGAANLIAEGTEGYPIVFTSIADDSYGFGGTFDTNNDRATSNREPRPGDWGGLVFNALTSGSLDRVVVTYGGGEIPIEGGFARFNAIEVQQADFRMTRSLVQNNALGLETANPQRNGRLSNEPAAIFVRGAQPVIVDNVIRNNQGAAIHINANALNSRAVVDSGRSTGPADRFVEFDDNYGPLIRMNRLANNELNGLHVRGAMLTVAGVWDDTDIVHVVQDEIMLVNHHTEGGLRLQSSPRESLVVKLEGSNAGYTASGTPMDIDDRIGGSLQILGTVGHPVVLTSLNDCTVGAGSRPDGMPQNSTLTTACPPGSEDDPGFRPGPVSLDLTTTNANLLRDQLLGPGVTAVGDATLVSGASSAGLFSGGSTSIRIPTGVVLSTGDVRNVEGPNTFGPVGSQQASLTGDPDLDAEFGVITTDTTSLEFQIQLDRGGPQDLFFSYLFASDEYNQFANSDYNDVFAFFVNGQNIAFIPGTTTPISINTINGGNPLGVNAQNPQYFNNNDPFDNGAYLADFGLNGFTNVFVAEARNLGPGVHTIKLAISDVLDTVFDSAVFLRSGSFANVPIGIAPEPGDWRSIRLDQYSHDRNVSPSNEQEFSYTGGHDVNGNPDTAEHLGALAPNEKSGDESRRLGFEVRGHISLDDPADMDVYSFDAEPGTVVWFDIDRTDPTLNTVLELIDSRGEVLASSDDLEGTLAESLTPQPWEGDFNSVNRHDAGMRVTLPGEPGETGTYFIRVRSAGPMLVDSPLTSLVFKNNGQQQADQITVTSVVPGENFLDRGFEAGQRLYVRGSSAAGRSNDGVYTIASVTAGPNFQTITLDPRDRLVDQAAPTGTILRSGVTSGAYQLQIRLRQTTEHSGSTVRHADIRYAANGIEIYGLPSHSNLLGESAEVNSVANSTPAGAQDLGNLLLSERNVVSVAGSLSDANDVDWYSFTLDYDFIQNAITRDEDLKTFPLVFDVDYADGLTRPDTTLALYRQDPDGIRLIAVARESNIQDDQPQPGHGLNLDDLDRGSAGKLDPFLGGMYLPAGTVPDQTTYFVALMSDNQLPTALTAQLLSEGGDNLVRLEPVNSVTRVVEDHIGFVGYTSGDRRGLILSGPNPWPAAEKVDPETGPILDIRTAEALETHVRPFTLEDVQLYVLDANRDAGSQIWMVNPYRGGNVWTALVDTTVPGSPDLRSGLSDIQDIHMRSDGYLYGYRRLPDNASNVGQLVRINTGIDPSEPLGSIEIIQNDNIAGRDPTPVGIFGIDNALNSFPSINQRNQVSTSDWADALTFERLGTHNNLRQPVYAGYYAVREQDQHGFLSDYSSKLYRFHPDTGEAHPHNIGPQGGIERNWAGVLGDIQLLGVNKGTMIIPVINQDGVTSPIQIEAKDAGERGNGITIQFTSANNQPTLVTSGAASLITRTITVRLNRNDDGDIVSTASQIVDAINANEFSRRLVLAALTPPPNNPADTQARNLTFLPSFTITNGVGTPLNGYVTGLAMGSYTGGQLYGVTSAGEFLRISKFNGRVLEYRDLNDDFGITNLEGLALGPQNVEDGRFANLLFAISGTGDLYALNPASGVDFGMPQVVFQSGNTVQEVSLLGDPDEGFFQLGFRPQTWLPIQWTDPIAVTTQATVDVNQIHTISFPDNPTGGEYRLTFDGQTTAPIAWNAPADVGINEEQQVALTGSPTGGTFTLQFGPWTTAEIAYNAPASVDIDELQQLQVLGDPNSGSFTLSFDGYTTQRIGWNAPAMDPGINEVQQVELIGPPTDGTFTLTFEGQTTADIPRFGTAVAVQAALEDLSNIGEGNVQVTGGPLPAAVQIEFTGALGSSVWDPMTADATNLVGGVVDVTTVTDGTPSVRQALVELDSIDPFDILVGGGPLPGNNISIHFQNDLGGQNVPALVPENVTLNTGPASVQINTLIDGRTSVQTLLEALPNINVGDIDVRGGDLPGTPIVIEFVGGLAGTDVADLIGHDTGLTGGTSPDVFITLITQGVSSVRQRLEELSNIEPGDVVVTGLPGGPYDVEFSGQYTGQNVQPMTGNGDDLTPPSQSVVVDITRAAVPSLRRVLEALPGINPGDVAVSRGPLDEDPLRIVFEGQYTGQNVPAMSWRSDAFYGYDPLPLGTEVLVEIIDASAIPDSTTVRITRPGIPGTGITGLAFSPLDFNLWHPTTTRGDEQGHGINPAPDNSRTPSGRLASVDGNAGLGRVQGGWTTKTDILEAEGHTSMYFGLERFEDSRVSNNDSRYYRYQNQGGQYGVLNRLTHLDLSSNPLIVIPEQGDTGGTYNLPGGAYGSLVTGGFSLEGYVSADKPMLYFNYYLETEDDGGETGGASIESNRDNPFRDSARVFISRDDGATWELLATNNSQLSVRLPASAAAELPRWLSDSATEGTNMLYPWLGLPPIQQQVQELFENTGTWRQARIDLGVYAGEPNLQMRFDFSTAGAMNDPSLGTSRQRADGWVDEQFGEFQHNGRSIRSENNRFEGFYIDDIIVGASERGEMVTGVAVDDSIYNLAAPRTNPGGAPRRLEGDYQLEIRRGPDYANLVARGASTIVVQQTFHTNERHVAGYTLIPPDPADVSDGMQFAIAGEHWAIFEYDTNGVVSEGVVRVDLNGISTAMELAGRIRTAINSAPDLGVTAILTGPTGQARIDLVDALEIIPHDPGDPSAAVAIGFETYNRRGDANSRREQGQMIIENNVISNVSEFAIRIGAGNRDPNSNLPHPGVPINFDTPNNIVSVNNNPALRTGLAPGVVVQNNILAYSGAGGIEFRGDPAAGLPYAAVPFGRIVNNTIYGSPSQTGTGILVDNNAAPTILNNILAGLNTGILVGNDSMAATLSGWNLYQNNAQLGNAFNAVNDLEAPATAPLFRDAQRGNFYLERGSVAIDSGLNSMQDRNSYVLVKQPLGIPQSPIFAPERDVYGQLRVDLPWADPLGAGPSVFRDRGAVEAADFDRPFAMLVDPVDGNGLDRDPNATVVYRTDDRLFEEFVLQLYDGAGFPRPIEGTGVDPLTVHPNTVSMTRDGVLLVEQTQVVPFDPTNPGDALLRRSSDYNLGFEGSNQVLRLTPASAIWESDRTYVISLNNRDRYLLTAADGAMIDDGDQFLIRDQAGNAVTFEYESGYKMWVPQTLTIHAIAGTQIGDGDTFTISDGQSTVVFEFDNNNTFNPDHRVIRFQATDTVEDVGQAIYQVLQEDRTLGLAPQYLGDRVHIGSQVFHSVDVTSNSNLLTSGIAGGIADGEQFTIEFTRGGVTETVTFEFDADGIVGLPDPPLPGEDPDDPADDYIEPQRIIAFDFSQTSEQLAQLVIAAIRAEVPDLAATTSLGDGFIHLRESIDSQWESYLLDTSSSRLWQTGQPGVTGAMLVQLPDDRYEIQAPAAGGAAINDNEIFTINDGTRTVTFEFDLDGSGPTHSWYISIPLTGTETQDRLAQMIQDAITSEGAFPDLEVNNLGAGLLQFAIAPDGAINTSGTEELNGTVRSGVTDGETFQVTRSGTTTLTFEFNNNGTFDPNHIQIGFSPTSSGAAVAQAMITAIGNAGVLGLTPVYLGGGTIRLNETPAHTFDRLESSLTVTGVPGGAVAIPYIPSASFTAENMAGAIISAINRTGFADFEARAKLRGGNTIFLDGAMMDPSLPNPDDAVQSITEDAIRAQYLPGIRDRAGNFLQSNQPDGATRFTIILGEATFDFGDLPDDPSRNDDFRTLLASGGARHVQVRDSQLRLGHLLDVEVEGQPSARADGDDANARVDLTGTPRLSLTLLPMTTIRVPDGWHIDDGSSFSITDADGRQKIFTMTTGPDGLFQVSYSLHDSPSDMAQEIVATINESMTDPNELDPLVGVTVVHIGDGLIQIAGASSVDLQDSGLHLVQVAPTRVEIPSDPAASGRALVDDGDTLTIDSVTFTFRSPAPVAPVITDIVFYEGEPPEILVWQIIQAVDAVVAAGQLSDVAALDAGNGVFEVHGTAEVAWQGSLRPYWQLPVNIQVTDGLLPLNGNLFTLADGRSPAVVFEFDNNDNLNDNSHQRVAIGSDANQTAANIAAAINQAVDAGLLQELVATSSGSSVSLVPFATTVGNAANDEDGIRFEGAFVPGLETSIVVTVSGGNGMLDGWIDWNNNGRFDAGEQVLFSEPVFEGENRLTITTPDSIDVDDLPYDTFARFRLSPSGGLAHHGLSVGGEVEDYRIWIVTPTAPVAQNIQTETQMQTPVSILVTANKEIELLGTGNPSLLETNEYRVEIKQETVGVDTQYTMVYTPINIHWTTGHPSEPDRTPDTFQYHLIRDSDGLQSNPGTVTVDVMWIPLYQNPDLHQDVNGDGIVSPVDALILINYLNDSTTQHGKLPDELDPANPLYPLDTPYLDVLGNGRVTAQDVLQVINYLNSQFNSSDGENGGEGEAPFDSVVTFESQPMMPGPLLVVPDDAQIVFLSPSIDRGGQPGIVEFPTGEASADPSIVWNTLTEDRSREAQFAQLARQSGSLIDQTLDELLEDIASEMDDSLADVLATDRALGDWV